MTTDHLVLVMTHFAAYVCTSLVASTVYGLGPQPQRDSVTSFRDPSWLGPERHERIVA